MRNVYLVTHAQSIHHIEGRVGGWYDTSLTEMGRKQAEKTGRYLESVIESQNVELFSSDLKRAAETGKIIGRHLQRDLSLDIRLREMSYGDAEGKPQSWFKTRMKPQPEDGDRLNHRIYPGAESRREIGERITAAMNDIIKKGAHDTVIVSHGFASSFIIMAWMNIPVSHMDYCNFPATPSSITLLQENDIFGNREVKYLWNKNHLG
jgi:probable phosphoglycerate mutase